MIGILALQGDFAAHARAMRELGREARMVRTAQDLEGLTGLILPGGESGTMLHFLQADGGGFWNELGASARRIPVFGTCAGAILLAREVTHPQQPGLGVLHVTIERNAYGRQIDSSIQTAQVEARYQDRLGATLEAVLIRAPRFRRLGPDIEVLARMNGEPVLLRQGNVLAATFHPELTQNASIHGYFSEMIAG